MGLASTTRSKTHGVTAGGSAGRERRSRAEVARTQVAIFVSTRAISGDTRATNQRL